MTRSGISPKRDVVAERPDVYTVLAEVFEAFFELDRDGFSGTPTTAGMNLALDEMGVSDRGERRRIRSLWRAMEAEYRAASKAARKKGAPEIDDA